MGKIVCLMGKSSTGKDTIYKHLMADQELALRPIVPYTTRPIRAGERDGVEYIFTDETGYLGLRGALKRKAASTRKTPIHYPKDIIGRRAAVDIGLAKHTGNMPRQKTVTDNLTVDI